MTDDLTNTTPVGISESAARAITGAIDAINKRLGWPEHYRLPCSGYMVYQRDLIGGIEVTTNLRTRATEYRIAGTLVGTAPRWGGIGNASGRCLLPHAPGLASPSPYVTALHDGGAHNALQLHLLTEHGTHTVRCTSVRRAARCHICQSR